jgi:hypothetical protein
MPCTEYEGQVYEFICEVRPRAYATNDSKYLAFTGQLREQNYSLVTS